MRKLYLYLILTISALLKMYQLGKAQFWYDEAFTRVISGLPFDRMIQATAGDTHPPGYYLITWGMVHLGLENEWWLRLPSVVFSLLTVYVVWLIVQRLDWSVGSQWGAVVLVAFYPFSLHYAQEARMYALLQLLFALGILAIMNAKPFWVAVICMSMLWVHNYGVFYGPTLVLVGIILHREMWWKWVVAGLSGAALWLPWCFRLLGQMDIINGAYWIQPTTAGGVVYAIYINFFNTALDPRYEVTGVFIISALFVLSMYELIRAKPDKWLVMLVVCLLPGIMAYLVDVLWQPVFLFRGLAGSGLFLTIIYGWMVGKNWARTFYFALLVLPIVVMGYFGHYTKIDIHKGETYKLVEMVDADTVYVYNDAHYISMLYYAPEKTVYHAIDCDITIGALSEQTRKALGVNYADFSDVEGDVYVIYGLGPTTPQCMVDEMDRDVAGLELVGTFYDDRFSTVQVYK